MEACEGEDVRVRGEKPFQSVIVARTAGKLAYWRTKRFAIEPPNPSQVSVVRARAAGLNYILSGRGSLVVLPVTRGVGMAIAAKRIDGGSQRQFAEARERASPKRKAPRLRGAFL